MRLDFFERLAPLCPRCLHVDGRRSPLALVETFQRAEDPDEVVSGLLECPHCRLEFPIFDGIPILVPDPADYLRRYESTLNLRDDLHPALAGRLIECAGTGSVSEATARQLGQYVWDHWGHADPQEPAVDGAGEVSPGQAARLAEVLARAVSGSSAPDGPLLDVGCATGGATVPLSRGTSRPVLGIDIHFPMVRWARQTVRSGRADYLRRRLGLLFDARSFPVDIGSAEVDFWVADIVAPPFDDATFAGGLAHNLLDCVASPLDALRQLARLNAPDALVQLVTPYDWNESIGPPAAWIGGHSPRGWRGGDSAALLRDLLTPGAHVAHVAGLEIVDEDDDIVWSVRIHDRCHQRYRAHRLLLRRAAG